MSEVGIRYLLPEAIELLRDAGQDVTDDVVKLDPEFVLEQVAKAPPTFEWRGRNPERTVTIGGDTMVFASVYGPPFVREGDVRRDAKLADFHNFVRLSHSFPEIDSAGGVVCEPEDAPLDSRHLDMIHAHLTLSDKPFMGSVISASRAEDTLCMLDIVFGGREEVRRSPCCVSLVNCNSPLCWDDRMLESMLHYARANQAVIVTPFLLMGAMSPVAIPASLAQQIAEAFAGIVLTQLVNPGTPVIFGSFLSNNDMQSGSPAFGTPESTIGLLATGQIARHYGLPFRTGGGLCTSPVCDAQAAYESLMTLMPTFLAGTNFVLHAAGWLEGALVACYEKFIVDIELLRMLRETFTPLEINEETMAFADHEEVGQGPGANFFASPYTLEHFRDCFYRPMLSTTENFTRYSRHGKDATARATDIWHATIEAYEPPPLDDGQRQELDEFVARRRKELGD